MNYLELLSAHYECIGTAGLFDSIASANFVEQGTVTEVTDGKFGNARGPCDGQFGGGGRGFSITPNGVFDTRFSNGFRRGTQLGWFRLDSTGSAAQEFSSQARSVAANNTKQYVIRCSQAFGGGDEGPVILIWDHTLNNFGISSGNGRGAPGDGAMPINTWCLIGWSIDLDTNILNFFTGIPGEPLHFIEIDTSGISAFRATVLDVTLLGIGSGHSTGGIEGDIDHVDWYNGYAFTEKDFSRFWNAGSGRLFPSGYIIGESGFISIAKLGLGGRGKRRRDR